MFKNIREALTKSRRHAAEINNWHQLCQEQQQRIAALEGLRAGQNAQIIELRNIATELRDRIQSHGMTGSERRFIDVCLNIFQNGAKLSQSRFAAAMREIKAERQSLEPFAVCNETIQVAINQEKKA